MMSDGTGRTATALVTFEGRPVATIGPFPVATPQWADVAPVAGRVERELGVPVAVLRLVDVTGGGAPRDGHVTYHAEALTNPAGYLGGEAGRHHLAAPAEPDSAALAEPDSAELAGPGFAALAEPAAHRLSWATAGGVRDVLAWADRALRDAGRPATGRPAQMRSWNLSGMFRIPTAAGPVWLKETPPFASDESVAIGLLATVAPDLVPAVVAADPARHRVILDHIPGDDCWHAPAEVVATAVRGLATAQAALAAAPPASRHRAGPNPPGAARAARLGEMPGGGLAGLGGRVHGLLDGEAGLELGPEDLVAARKLADAVPGMVAELDACGLPETLVHCDFHPGNWRWDGRRDSSPVVLVDFADAGLGHPALDGLRPGAFLDPARAAVAVETWVATWREHRPGSDPARALALAPPLVHLTFAVRYQEFLDGIETSERRYHEGDPAAQIRRAVGAAR
jgi:hypothetical protein